ncbi:hypothetical protein NKH18_28350 [Streptomyces sp. M10(2022)]
MGSAGWDRLGLPQLVRPGSRQAAGDPRRRIRPGASNGQQLYAGLENGDYPFISTLRSNGFDVVLLGFTDRSASIIANADVAIECIRRTIADRDGDAPLTVGGFSMGGLVTRYALAKMERQRSGTRPPPTCPTTPAPRAWLPLGVQAFAHFVKENWGSANPLLSLYSDLVNSPAARQMLRWHLGTGADATLDVAAGQDQERTEFLAALERVGSWPQIPACSVSPTEQAPGGEQHPRRRHRDGRRRNRAGRPAPDPGGRSADRRPDGEGGPEPGGDPHHRLPRTRRCSGRSLPKAPLLEDAANFGMAAMLAKIVNKQPVDLAHNTSTFVPTVSAVAAAGIDDDAALYSKIDPESSSLHDFLCATTNEGHTVMTTELGEWILARLQEA